MPRKILPLIRQVCNSYPEYPGRATLRHRAVANLDPGEVGQTPGLPRICADSSIALRLAHEPARGAAGNPPPTQFPLPHTFSPDPRPAPGREIENFRHRVGGFHEPLASEFRAAGAQWMERAERQLHEVRAVLSQSPPARSSAPATRWTATAKLSSLATGCSASWSDRSC